MWIAAVTVFAVGLWALDIFCLQKNPVIWIDNYSDIVLTIWEIQATIASLTLASAAFILAKIDDSYYGISIKMLFHLPRRYLRFGLSFWERIICSIILPITTWFFVVLDNITAVSYFLLVTVYLAARILAESINVITKSETYSEWAKQLVDHLVEIIVAPSNEKEKKRRGEIEKRFSQVIDGIEREISAEIRRGVNIYDNNTYLYFVQLMNHYSCQEMVRYNDQMYATLIEWLRVAIDAKSEQNIHTILRASYSTSLKSQRSATGINVFMRSYYQGDISKPCFQQAIERIEMDILQADHDYTNKAMFLLRNTIYYADVDTFVKVIRAVWRSKPYDNPRIKSNVLITAVAYLYYMSFKEQYMPIEKGYSYLGRLRGFASVTILESYQNPRQEKLKDILADTDLVFDGVVFLLDFFNEHAFNWEYVSLAEAKSVQLPSDTIEFLTFYCCLFIKNTCLSDLFQISLDTLLKMKSYMNADGAISDTHSEKYLAFCKWLGKEEDSNYPNEWFYASLISTIKEKMIVEAERIRAQRDVWENKICETKREIVECVSKSALYMGELPNEERSINLRFCDFCLLKNFSENYAVYGIDRVIQAYIENKMFLELLKHGMLEKCGIKIAFRDFEESIISFEEMIKIMREEGIDINQSYNSSFFNRFSIEEFRLIFLKKYENLTCVFKMLANGTQDIQMSLYMLLRS